MEYDILGDDFQAVEFSLSPGEFVVAEPGAMIYKTEGIEMTAALGGGGNRGIIGSVLGAGKRMLTGESAFMTYWKNAYNQKETIAFSAPYPGKIVPIDLRYGEVVCQKDGFLCADADVAISVFFQKKIMTAMFGGSGFIMQKLSGTGTAFISAGGFYKEVELAEGERFQCDPACVLAFEPGVRFHLAGTGSLTGMMFGGEGVFFADFVGPGHVWVQSMPFGRFAAKAASVLHRGR